MQVAQDMLWVWGDASATAAEESQARDPLLLPELDPSDPSRDTKGEPVSPHLKPPTRVPVFVLLCMRSGLGVKEVIVFSSRGSTVAGMCLRTRGVCVRARPCVCVWGGGAVSADGGILSRGRRALGAVVLASWVVLPPPPSSCCQRGICIYG